MRRVATLFTVLACLTARLLFAQAAPSPLPASRQTTPQAP